LRRHRRGRGGGDRRFGGLAGLPLVAAAGAAEFARTARECRIRDVVLSLAAWA